MKHSLQHAVVWAAVGAGVAAAGALARLALLNAPGIGDWAAVGLLDFKWIREATLILPDDSAFVGVVETLVSGVAGFFSARLSSARFKKLNPHVLPGVVQILLQVLFSWPITVF